MFFFLVSAVCPDKESAASSQNHKSTGFCCYPIAASEHSIHFAKIRVIDGPAQKAVSKAFILHSKEPEFPTGMLFGLCLGLAFRGGCEHFIGVRQSRTLLAVQRTKSLHQGQQLVLLQLEVQFDA